MDRFSINPRGEVEYGADTGPSGVHEAIIAGDLEKAINLSKGTGDRELVGVRGEPQNLTIPIPKVLSKGHPIRKRLKFKGLDISIESPAGAMRHGTSEDGTKWSSLIHFDYGYIKGTMAPDGDHVDCFIGPHKDCSHVYVIHQRHLGTGKFDEDKCMLGWLNQADALRDYLKNYNRSDQVMGITKMTMEEFKKKLPGTNDKPMMIKAKVKAHTRRMKSGKVVQVREHEDIRKRGDDQRDKIVGAIRRQIGQGTFAMLGARNLFDGTDQQGNHYLQFKIGTNPSEITHIKVTLNKSDTYDIDYGKLLRNLDYKIIDSSSGILGTNIVSDLGRRTGLATTLGPKEKRKK